jgi:hypothetical protein
MFTIRGFDTHESLSNHTMHFQADLIWCDGTFKTTQSFSARRSSLVNKIQEAQCDGLNFSFVFKGWLVYVGTAHRVELLQCHSYTVILPAQHYPVPSPASEADKPTEPDNDNLEKLSLTVKPLPSFLPHVMWCSSYVFSFFHNQLYRVAIIHLGICARETREWWSLLTVATEANGDLWSTNERVLPWLVRSACLACTIGSSDLQHISQNQVASCGGKLT